MILYNVLYNVIQSYQAILWEVDIYHMPIGSDSLACFGRSKFLPFWQWYSSDRAQLKQ